MSEASNPGTCDPATGLQLDDRQIAMLKAMGVRVWQESAPSSASITAPVEARTGQPIATQGTARVQAPAPQARPIQASVASPVQTPAGATTPTAASGHASNLSWPDLQLAVRDCQRCGLCQHRKNTVFGTGPGSASPDAPPKVDWLLVGEAPGEQEDLAGEPFVGQAGKLLDNILACLGLSRQSATGGGLFIANTIKCRPPANRNPLPAEIEACAPWLERQIELLQPKLIVAMGRFAAQSLLAGSVPDIGKVPLGKLRGQIHRYGQTPVVVTYHPAYLLRNLPDKAKAWEDWVLAQSNLRNL
jgi:DNA polymerase